MATFVEQRTGDGLKKAIEYFTVAIEKDPNYAQAYAGLADSYALSGDWEYRDSLSARRFSGSKGGCD